MEHDQAGDIPADTSTNDEPAPTSKAELALYAEDADTASGRSGAEADDVVHRHWRAEMARWLLTLNPGRTQEEYAKAVRYFFEADGVPQDLDELSADLLLAYRGALAMRAQRGRPSRWRSGAAPSDAARVERLSGRDSRTDALPGAGARRLPRQPTALAPATVNVRLTALRQFLRFAALRQPIDGLTPERMQAALRRLPIERRRPYQILGEDEWPAFLATARLPMAPDASAARVTSQSAAGRATGPWGMTMAQRQRIQQATTAVSAQAADPEPGGDDDADDRSRRSSDGRTGALTGQRDYALVALALATGLRAIELSLLDVGDLTRERHRGSDEWWLTLPDEKTKGQRGGRTLPLAPDLVTTVIEYLRSTGRSLASQRDRETPLFTALPRGHHVSGRHEGPETGEGIDARRLRPEQIRGVINRIETQWLAWRASEGGDGSRTGDDRRISPHALRHSAAIALLKGSESSGRPPASVEHVRGWLGHFDIRTTQRYLDHLNSREERRRFTIAPLTPNPAPSGSVSGKGENSNTIAPEEN